MYFKVLNHLGVSHECDGWIITSERRRHSRNVSLCRESACSLAVTLLLTSDLENLLSNGNLYHDYLCQVSSKYPKSGEISRRAE